MWHIWEPGEVVDTDLVVRSEGKTPFERPRRRREDNIKLDHQEVGWGGRHWIDLAQVRDR
jgi:hypothetical protein